VVLSGGRVRRGRRPSLRRLPVECSNRSCGRDYTAEEYEELEVEPQGRTCSEDGCGAAVSDECAQWRDCRVRLR
jgi:hypothetical protein